MSPKAASAQISDSRCGRAAVLIQAKLRGHICQQRFQLVRTVATSVQTEADCKGRLFHSDSYNDCLQLWLCDRRPMESDGAAQVPCDDHGSHPGASRLQGLQIASSRIKAITPNLTGLACVLCIELMPCTHVHTTAQLLMSISSPLSSSCQQYIMLSRQD